MQVGFGTLSNLSRNLIWAYIYKHSMSHCMLPSTRRTSNMHEDGLSKMFAPQEETHAAVSSPAHMWAEAAA